jgi:predicted RecA/RadA family phage recombinase
MESNVIKSMCDNDTVRYSHTSAVSAGELIYVAGLGVLRATAAYDADAEGVYQNKGVITVPITSGVSVSQGDKCYWDISANTIITSSMVSNDFYLGRAEEAGTAAGGYADIDISAKNIDYRSSDGKLPKLVCVAADTALLTAATTQVPLATGLLSTDTLVVQMNSAGVNPGYGNVPHYATPSDGYFTVPFTSAPTNGGLSWAAFRAV